MIEPAFADRGDSTHGGRPCELSANKGGTTSFGALVLLGLGLFFQLGNFFGFSYRRKTLRGMRIAAYKAGAAMRPPQARVSQAKLFLILICTFGLKNGEREEST